MTRDRLGSRYFADDEGGTTYNKVNLYLGQDL